MRRIALSLALLTVLAACGDSPLGLDAAKDLLPRALEEGTALKDRLLAIDSAEAAAAAKGTLEPLVAGYAEMVEKLGAVEGMLGGALAPVWAKVREATNAIRAKAAGWAADEGGTGAKIVEALGGDLVERIMSLGR